MFIEDVLLYFFKSGDVMRYSTLYHLLKGKKTTSVLSYGKLHQLLDYFYLFPKLSKNRFDQAITNLIDKGMLEKKENNVVRITTNGKESVTQHVLSNLEIKGYDWYKYDETFWQRLLFTSQVISYKSYKVSDYLPIDNDPIHQLNLKKWLSLCNQDESRLIKGFYNEWQNVIQVLTEDEQDVLVSQLVGYDVIGYTLSQIAKQKNRDRIYVYLLYKSALHKVLNQINITPSDYPLMASIIDMIQQEKEQDTVDLTAYLLSKGHSIDEVSRMRRLKESTITDHFIEISINKQATELISYVSDCVKYQLAEYAKEHREYKTWKYSQVVTDIPEMTFYEFKFYQFYLLEEGDNQT